MKNFIKIFFIIVYTFISFGMNSVDAVSYAVQAFPVNGIATEISAIEQEIGVLSKNNESSFVTSNTQNTEINIFRDKKDNFSAGFFDKVSLQNRILQEIFISNYNKTNYSTSHKISPILKNEICTRAP